METTVQTEWTPSLIDPSGIRLSKPRQSGRTMIMDKGIGLNAFEDLLDTSAPYVDLIKFGFGTSPLYPLNLLQRKIELARAHDLIVYPGGTFLEVAVTKQEVPAYFDMLRRVGFNGLEVSDGTIEMSRFLRNDLIERGRDMGLFVVTEYGKKAHGSVIELDSLFNTIHHDIEFGAELVIIEARESGRGVGLFDDQGDCRADMLTDIIGGLHNRDRIMWEAPLKQQQVHLLTAVGPRVNLGNISSDEILSLECLRRGLRADTFYHS